MTEPQFWLGIGGLTLVSLSGIAAFWFRLGRVVEQLRIMNGTVSENHAAITSQGQRISRLEGQRE